MKKACLLILFLPMFSCSDGTETTLAQKQGKVGVTSVQGVEKKEIRKPSFEYFYPTQAKSTSPHPIEGEDTLVANIGEYSYTLAPTGEIREESNKDKSAKTFKLKTEEWIESAYFYIMGDSLLVYYTDTDGEGATSYAELINRNTGKTVYSTNIEGFNLGMPIIAGEKSYVSAIGFVGKLDLPTGKFDWKHNDLYDHQKYSFNSFDTVFVCIDAVEFISKNYHSKTTDKIIVSDKTGELVKVIK